MARDHPPLKHLWLVRCGVLGVWVLFASMVIAISWGAAASRNRPFDFIGSAAWNLGWVLWAPATFAVQALTRRFPVERRRVVGKIFLHVAFGLGVTAGMLGVEFSLNDALHRVWPETIRANPLSAFVVYKFHIYFLIYWLIVGASGAYDYYARLQRSELTASRLEAQLAQAQVQALKMQLHPHFLFNTHHSIICLMMKNDNPAAIKMLTRLSDLLRITLRKTDQPMNSLAEELEMLDLYLGIQRERYQERLTVEMQIPSAALEAEVPCLLLQPLVENALQHAIDPQAAGGRLTIVAQRVDDRLEMTVRDNGPGFPAGFALQQSQGVGLKNTEARLRCLYGARQQLAIRQPPGGGAEVRLVLPWRKAVATVTASGHDPAVISPP